MMTDSSKMRTPEQISKKMLNEERTIIDLQLAIKKEQFQHYLKSRTKFYEGYDKVDTSSHDCWMFT
ncbi:hypothetical protein [Nitrosopumilus sp.]|uniref:hypothetical protein n=1 Tax=Nitrosopumilus sp. TaxID=2024843 RepID=UPI0034A074EC